MDASLATEVLRVAGRYGNSDLLDEYIAGMRRMTSPETYYNVSEALSDFRGQQQIERVLQLAVSPESRNQDAPGLIAAVFGKNNVFGRSDDFG